MNKELLTAFLNEIAKLRLDINTLRTATNAVTPAPYQLQPATDKESEVLLERLVEKFEKFIN